MIWKYNNFLPLSQSVYYPLNGAETVLLKVIDGNLLSLDERQVSRITLLKHSTAFDSTDHSTLLSSLTTVCSILDSALVWFGQNPCAVLDNGLLSVVAPLAGVFKATNFRLLFHISSVAFAVFFCCTISTIHIMFLLLNSIQTITLMGYRAMYAHLLLLLLLLFDWSFSFSVFWVCVVCVYVWSGGVCVTFAYFLWYVCSGVQGSPGLSDRCLHVHT